MRGKGGKRTRARGGLYRCQVIETQNAVGEKRPKRNRANLRFSNLKQRGTRSEGVIRGSSHYGELTGKLRRGSERLQIMRRDDTPLRHHYIRVRQTFFGKSQVLYKHERHFLSHIVVV